MSISPLLWIPAFLAGVYVLIMALVYFFQEYLIFHPRSLPADHAFDFPMPFEEHNIQAYDGARLNALFFPAQNAKGVVVYFHGNASNLEEWGALAPYFTKRSYSLLIWDYRTFGKSDGPITYENLLQDAETVFEWAQSRYPDLPLIPYGTSIGTGMAAYVAKKYKPEKVILETPFDSMQNLARHHFPWLPQGWILRYPFNPLQWLQATPSEVYMIHGTTDKVIPSKCAQNLQALLGRRAKLKLIQNGRHNDLENHAPYHLWLDQVFDVDIKEST